MGSNMTMTMSNGGAVRESCRQMLESWLNRDMRRIMLFAEPLDVETVRQLSKADRSEKDNKNKLF